MGSWVVGGSLNVGRMLGGSCGTQTAGLSFGGQLGAVAGNTLMDDTEEYNGTTWSVSGDLNTAVSQNAGCGIQTAGLSFGGYVAGYVATTEEYNGTIWSSGGDLSTARSSSGGAGLQTAGLSIGGSDGGYLASTEEYNGTAWSAGGDLDAAVSGSTGAGILTAALSIGGGASREATEEYNGTIWTAGGSLTIGRLYCGGCGIQTAALAFGGDFAETATATSEEYTGTAWASGGDLNTAIYRNSGAGGLTSGLSFGGSATLATATTVSEEYATNYGQHRGVAGIDGGTLFNGQTIIGDRTNGTLYALDMNTYTDAGTLIKRVRRTQIINKQRVNVIHSKVEVEFEPGVGLDVAESADGYDPQANLKWSDDGGNTFSDGRDASIGEYEDYGTRAIWRALGKSRNRIYELTITEPVKVVLIGAYSNLKPCKF